MNNTTQDIYASISLLNQNLIISIPGDMNDADLESFSEVIMNRGYHHKLNGAVLDFSAVSIMDSYMYQNIVQTTKALQLMGVEVIWTSLRPEVVMALMDLNMSHAYFNIHTAVSMALGIQKLNYLKSDN